MQLWKKQQERSLWIGLERFHICVCLYMCIYVYIYTHTHNFSHLHTYKHIRCTYLTAYIPPTHTQYAQQCGINRNIAIYNCIGYHIHVCPSPLRGLTAVALWSQWAHLEPRSWFLNTTHQKTETLWKSDLLQSLSRKTQDELEICCFPRKHRSAPK